MKWCIPLFLCFITSLFAGSVRMMNDTPFALIAEVSSADGKKKGSVTIPPNTNATWHDALDGAYTWSQTPYSVTFYCQKSGQQYGIVDDVQQAATIQASMASGPRTCTTPKKKGEDEKKEKPSESEAQQNWQNTEPPGDPIWGPP